MQLFPYLKMHDNAMSAINRYKQIFNGNISRLQLFKDSPLATQKNSQLIIHAQLHFKGNIICFADMISKQQSDQIKKQQNQQLYELCLNFEPKQYQNAKEIYNGLGKNGQVLMMFQKTFWGAYYGKVKDQFGIVWSLNCPIQQEQKKENNSPKKQENQKKQDQHKQSNNSDEKSQKKHQQTK